MLKVLTEILFILCAIECCNTLLAPASSLDEETNSIIRDIKFEIPDSVRDKKGVYIRIIVDNKEIFLGSLDAVKAGDFNFTIPENIIEKRKNSMIVDFFIPPSQSSIGQTAFIVDMSDKPAGNYRYLNRAYATVLGSAAVIALGTRQLLRNSAESTILVGDAHQIKLPIQDIAPSMQDVKHPTPSVDIRNNHLVNRLQPQVSSTTMKQLQTPAKCDQLALISNQLEFMKKNKITAAAIGEVVMSYATSTYLRFSQKDKIKTSPINIVDKNYAKVRGTMMKSWKTIRKQLQKH